MSQANWSALRREKADRKKAEAEKQKAEAKLNTVLEFISRNPSLPAAEILDKMTQGN